MRVRLQFQDVCSGLSKASGPQKIAMKKCGGPNRTSSDRFQALAVWDPAGWHRLATQTSEEHFAGSLKWVTAAEGQGWMPCLVVGLVLKAFSVQIRARAREHTHLTRGAWGLLWEPSVPPGILWDLPGEPLETLLGLPGTPEEPI